MAGTWVWETVKSEYTVNFRPEEGASGAMPQKKLIADEDSKIPKNAFVRYGYRFKQWNDGQGHTYEDKGTIPANTYAKNAVVTLTAEFEPVNTTANMTDGEFEISLLAGEMATFDDIPAGTAYQVWEDTPDGWVLVQQVDTSGNIIPLENANAVFTNKYQPGITTAQFNGVKTLDGQAASAGTFQFNLIEDGEIIQTVSTKDGGFIQFDVIEYEREDAGTHIYTIEEADPNLDTIDYDTHKETVRVVVTDNGDGTLSSKVEYDSDGIRFANKTRPGMLKITKNAETTKSNENDVFHFRVSFNNEAGQPLGDGISWYVLDKEGNAAVNTADAGSNKRDGAFLRSVREMLGEPFILEADAATDLSGYPESGAEISQSGTSGTCTWELWSDGTLIIRPSEGSEGTLNAFTSGSNGAGAPWYQYRTNVKRAKVQGTVYGGTSICNMFYGMSNMESVDLSGLNTVNVENFSSMFAGCRSLDEIDTSALDTSRATNMSNMFSACTSVTELDVSNFNMSSVTTISGMFNECSKLEDIIGEGSWDLSSLKNMYSLFCNCKVLTSVDVADWNISGVDSLSSVFMWCYKLETADVSNWDTSNVTSFNRLFYSCEQLSEIDVSNWDTSSLTYIGSVFSGCKSVTELDVSNWDTSKVTSYVDGGSNIGPSYNKIGPFASCSSLKSLDLSNWKTAAGVQMTTMFYGCRALETLDISGFDTSSVTNMANMFQYCDNLKRVVLSENYRFTGHNITTQAYKAVLPTPTSNSIYTGRWIKEDLSDEPHTAAWLRDNYNADLAGAWVWEVDETKGLVKFDANGGYTSAKQIISTSESQSVVIPGSSNTTRLHYILTGWNTEADGSGTSYESGQTYNNIIQLGKVVTLYAQWEDSDERNYKVEHYQENYITGTYDLTATVTFTGAKGTKVTPDTNSYPGFIVPEKQTVTIADDDSTVVRYYYNRIRYKISFDGNGATSGRMNDQEMVYDIAGALPENKFQKTGSIFTGWNTKADGSGKGYTNLQVVNNLSSDGTTVVLYAIWMDNPNEELTPTNGTIEVSCKAGETIVIPNLPAGTTYTVEEIDDPSGWKETGTVGTEGTIQANQISEASVTNEYEAKGQIELEAHKLFEGHDLEGSEFEFELIDNRGEVIQTKSNGSADTDDTVAIADEDGNVTDEPNPWKGTGLVSFDAIEFTEDDIGQTYTYTIREKAGDDTSVNYDDHVETVTVTISDKGGGILDVQAQYDSDGALFTNTRRNSSLTLTKEVTGNAGNADGKDFTFTVQLKDAKGDPLAGEYPVIRLVPDQRPVMETQLTHQSQTRYSHTPNISDDGTQSGNYSNNMNSREVVTIEGAEKLHVMITFGGESANWDWACMWAGSHPTYTAASNYSTSITGKLGGGSHTSSSNTRTYDVDGDTVTFAFRSDSSGVGDGYGYYAVITSEDAYEEVETGEMEDYIREDEIGTVSDGGTVSLKAGETIRIDGLPIGAGYEISETEQSGWSVIEKTGEKGTITDGEPSEALFTNAYSAEGRISFEATKSMTGKDLEKDMFSFGIYDENGTLISTAKNKADGGISFDPIYYDETDAGKTFRYTVKEIDEGAGGIVYDETEYNIDVEVTDNGDGTLTAAPSQNASSMTFSNEYTASGLLELKGRKDIVNREFKAGDEWKVTISADESTPGAPLPEQSEISLDPETGKTSASFGFGEIEYSLADAGKTYKYKVTESGTVKGVVNDSNDHIVTVSIRDNGDGTLEIRPQYDDGDELVLTNTYNAKGSTTLKIYKAFNAWENADSFGFTLTPADGAPMPEDNHDGKAYAGKDTPTAVFGTIEYTSVGTYEYVITEDIPEGAVKKGSSWYKGGITYDGTEHHVVVSVTDPNKDGEFVVKVKYDGTEASSAAASLTIENSYDATGSIGLTLSKEITGRDFQNGDEWKFKITGVDDQGDTDVPLPVDEDGNTADEVTIKPESGSTYSFKFNDIPYTYKDAGKTFTYTVTESGEIASVENGGPVTITVTVKDNGNGTLDVKKDEDLTADDLTFTNTYTSRGEDSLKASKDFNEWGNKDSFTLALTAVNGAPMPVGSDGKELETVEKQVSKDLSEADFGTIVFTKAGEYQYEIREVVPGDAENADGVKYSDATDEQKAAGGFILNGIEYDTAAHTATVKVTEHAPKDGELDTEVTYGDGDKAVLTNNYTAEGDITFKGVKSIDKRDLADHDIYRFTVSENGKVIQAVENNSETGEIDFEKITYVLDRERSDLGEHIYTISEEAFDEDGIRSDDKEYTVKVKVTDNGDGTLDASEEEGGDDHEKLDFENKYSAEGNVEIPVTKKIEGRDWRINDSFDFVLKALDGAPMPEREKETGDGSSTDESESASDDDRQMTVTISSETGSQTGSFGTIKYTKDDMVTDGRYVTEKTFRYELTEKVPEEKAIYMAYDENTYIVEVKAVDDGKGKIDCSVEYSIKGSDESAEVGDNNDLIITNTYEATELILTKKMPVRVSGEGVNQTVIFEITGTDETHGKDDPLYHTFAGITFNDGTGQSEQKILRDVPKNCTITVEEVYEGNYDAVEKKISKAELEEVDGEMVWVFEFENDHGDNRYGDGVVNRYSASQDGVVFEKAEN